MVISLILTLHLLLGYCVAFYDKCSYENGCDTICGYACKGFTHGTVGTAAMGSIVNIIVTLVGLVSEALNTCKNENVLQRNRAIYYFRAFGNRKS